MAVNFTRRIQILAISALASLLPAGRGLAASVTLTPVADTSLFAVVPDNNLGATSNLVAGVNGTGSPGRALMRFDLAGQIPTNAMIQSASLTIGVITVPSGGGVVSAFDVRRVLRAWGEGAGASNTGSPASAGDATWNNCLHPATPWSMPGGDFTNDFATTVSAVTVLTNLGTYTFGSTPAMVNDVQLWLSNPATNFGWVLISESEAEPFTARRMGSRENIGNEPKLTINYSLPTPDVTWIAASNGQVRFSFVAQAGQPYTVQFSETTASNAWITLTNVSPQPATTNLMLTDSQPTNAQRFYRVGNF